jgi:NADPH-dependent ferric siderophore reductase
MTTTPIRREPPPFRRAAVRTVARVAPRVVAIALEGSELRGMPVPEPAASVRLLVPRPETDRLELPSWTGNEFRFDDGARPPIRTLTPLRVDPAAGELDVEVVLHGAGPLSSWAEAAEVGDEVAVSGPGRGYDVDPSAERFLLAGDESARPAIAQLLGVLPHRAAVDVIVEVAADDGRVPLPAHPMADVEWRALPAGAEPGDALVEAVVSRHLAEGTRIWVAGEAAAVQRIRKHLFDGAGVPRDRAVVRGYWKHGRAGT